MKAKKKFDPKIIQQFVIDHTEKFVIGVAAALFLYFTYNSLTSLPPYKEKPETLDKATAAAAAKLVSGPLTKKAAEVAKFPAYGDMIDQFKTPVDPHAYPMKDPLYWKQYSPLRLRPTPEVLAVEHLRAVPGRGAIAKDNGATAGKRWVVVTGLVPYKKQLKEYRSKFESAASFDPGEDVPKYAGFFVQKAEVVPGANAEPKWSKPTVGFKDANAAVALWGGKTARDPADPRFVLPQLVSPLPLLADAPWGNDAVSPPAIPVVEHPAPGPAGPGGVFGPQPGGLPGVGRGPDPAPGAPAPLGPGLGPATGGNNPLAGEPAKPDNPNPVIDESQVPEYLLLRYLDFDIKPDKQYQYRIFLVLANPNCGLDRDVLEDPDSSGPPLLGVVENEPDAKSAKWSGPCISDRVPGEMRLLGGSVLAATGLKEISAEVRVLLWQEKTGRNSNCSIPGLVRGAILNFKDAAFKTPGAASVTQGLLTNSILVDLMGGEPLGRQLKSPGMVLVLDEAGNLVIHDEAVEDEEWVTATKEPAGELPPAAAPPPQTPGVPGATPAPQIAPVPTNRTGRGGR
jgi:hypothetical protein